MSADQLTILAVDDEQSQLEDLARLLRGFPCVGEVECAFDGHDALKRASAECYDAIFLDVRMPALDGVELGRVLRRFAAPPQLVFVSAYEAAAVDAFELRALDYLRKPVSRRRVEEALERVVGAIEAAEHRRPGAREAVDGDHRLVARDARESPDPDTIAASNTATGAIRLIARGSVLYAQSYGDFIRIVTDDGRYLLRATLAELEHRWAQFGFVRVHRQYVANLARAIELRPQLGGTAELAFADGQTIPVARRHVGELSRRLGL